MASAEATRTRRGHAGLLRSVLLGTLLVAAVITGLLAMHTLNLHGTPAAHTSAAVSVSVADSAQAHQGAAVSHLAGGSTNDPGWFCTDCGNDDHLNMAMTCVLALLLVMLLLVPPRMLPGWLRVRARHVPDIRRGGSVPPGPPSLHVLCISRT